MSVIFLLLFLECLNSPYPVQFTSTNSLSHYHHHWHHSPRKAKTWLRTFANAFLSNVIFLQIKIPYLSQILFHIFLDLPLFLLPSMFPLYSLFSNIPSSVHSTCLNYLIICIIHRTMSKSYSPLLTVLHSPVLILGPKIPLRTFLPHTAIFCASFLSMCHVSEA